MTFVVLLQDASAECDRLFDDVLECLADIGILFLLAANDIIKTIIRSLNASIAESRLEALCKWSTTVRTSSVWQGILIPQSYHAHVRIVIETAEE